LVNVKITLDLCHDFKKIECKGQVIFHSFSTEILPNLRKSAGFPPGCPPCPACRSTAPISMASVAVTENQLE